MDSLSPARPPKSLGLFDPIRNSGDYPGEDTSGFHVGERLNGPDAAKVFGGVAMNWLLHNVVADMYGPYFLAFYTT